MEWGDIEVTLVLLRTRSLSRAASRLGVDRSTVSRRLAALERALGAQLFVRTRDGLKPTAALERVRPVAERMEAEAAAFANAAKASAERPEGIVRLATTEALATVLVTGGLLRLHAEHPSLVLEVLTGNAALDLERGEADLAVRLTPLSGASLRVRHVARLGLGLFASPAYVRARGAPAPRGSLAGHDVLLPTGELAALPEAKWLARQKGTHVVLRSNSMPVLLAAALEGRGIVALGLAWGERVGLQRLRHLEHLGRRSIWLALPTASLSRPAVQVVSREVAAICARVFGPVGRAANP